MALMRDAIVRRDPDASDDEVGLRFVAKCYGDELATEVRAALAARREMNRPAAI